MMQITCKQIGIEDCPFTSMGKDMLETTKVLHEHLKSTHPDFLNALTEEDGDKLNNKILDVLEPQRIEEPAEEPEKPLSTDEKPSETPAG